MKLDKIKYIFQTRWGFFGLLVFLFWLKTILTYFIDFNLGVKGIYQIFVLLINPLATTMLLLGIALYVKRTIPAYLLMILIYIANTALLIFNVIYYREFTDFMTINTIFGYSTVSQGLSGSSLALVKPQDVILIFDFIILALGFVFKIIKFDTRQVPRVQAISLSIFSLMFLMLNITLGEIDRPQLLGRTFDRNYLVKYLGIDTYTLYDGLKTARNSQVRDSAGSSDLNEIIDFKNQHYAAPNPKMFGVAKGKNVIIIHLESFQQFLIDYKLDGKEVTPFINSLYHSNDTYSFSNFFNQVGQGKTSDAENMLETSTYGLPQGSLFSMLGSDNTFQASPAILNQTSGYTSAVFHGNAGSFWNRNSVYKNFGYNYFFDASYYDTKPQNLTEYGLKDKLLFHDSVKYLERLQQPFLAKFITVSNHFPYALDKANTDFKAANTSDESVNNYFVTAHYLDQALQEFFEYLKKSGLYDDTMIVMYGDHYGISNTRNLKLAPLLGKSASTWNKFDDTQMQRVPFMIHIPGNKNGGIQQQYGGEIDVLPTIEHLLGINSQPYLQFGTDLFSKQHDQTVAFRNENFVTPKYTVIGNTIYENNTGNLVTHPSNKIKKYIQVQRDKVSLELSLSDTLNNKNLLRFYIPHNFTPIDPKFYNYKNQMNQLIKIENKLGKKSKSIWSTNNNKSTIDDYSTNAPELSNEDSDENSSNSSESSTTYGYPTQ